MSRHDTETSRGPGSRSLRDILFGDLRVRPAGEAGRGAPGGASGQVHGPGRTLGRDLRDLYGFYLDEEARGRLAEMGRLRRWATVVAWALKSLLLKLSPPRRLMLAAAMVMFIMGQSMLWIPGLFRTTINLRGWSFVLLLLLFMLELKDKLLARDEIELAREVQLALLPREHPVVPGWSVWSSTRPANDAGGDLVDYIPLGPRSVGVALGDVAGKGLGAALLMARLQAMLRALAPGAASLAGLGGTLNGIFERDGPGNRFATLFLFRIDTDAAGRLRYLNAGHDPPFVVRAAPRSPIPADRIEGIEELHASSYPLGMFPGAEYAEGEVDLRAGDLLVVYSDGVIDARNPAGEEFGRERLWALIPGLRGLDAEAAGRHLLDELDRFLAGERPPDDISLVLARRA